MAAARPSTSTRWVTGIMVVALLASVLVVVGLIQITGESPSSAGGTGGSESAAPATGSPSDSASADPASTSPAAAPSGTRSGATAPSTTPVELAGSGLDLPAAWTGTAELTIEVHGRCADTGGTSFYTRPAQFALQVSLPPAAGPSRASGSTSAGAPGSSTAGPSDSSAPVTDATTTPVPATAAPVSMTLGITPTDVPGLSIYSTSSSRDGSVRRTWAVDARADPAAADRTLISATLLDDQPVGGALPPNLLVDSETDLLPCESGTGVRLPRPLAKGATVTGWVSAAQASLDVTATTTDGERSMQAHLDLARTPGP